MTLVISASDEEKTRELVGTSAGAIKGAAPGLRPLAKALTGLRVSAAVCEDRIALLATALVLSAIVRSTQGIGADAVSLPGADVRFFCWVRLRLSASTIFLRSACSFSSIQSAKTLVLSSLSRLT